MAVMKNNIEDQLIADWEQLVAMGCFTKEELIASLQEQVSGYHDMSVEEYCVDYAMILGKGWGEILTDDQIDIWRDIVNRAADKYLSQ